MDEERLDFGQLYGYAVCLLAIVAFLAASAVLTKGILDLREPPYTTTFRSGPSLVSEEAYRLDLLERMASMDGAAAASDWMPADSTIDRMYERERLYRLALSHQVSRKMITITLVLMGLTVGVFVAHWLWLRRRERPPGWD